MATISDVARRAGVSVSTVSYVLSGKRPISSKTARRVKNAIRALGYQPHAGARALAAARSKTLGLMVPLRTGVDFNVIMQFVSGVTAAAHDRDYDLLLVTHGDDSNLSRVAGGSMIDALVVMDIGADDPRLAQLRRLKQPAVLIGLPSDSSDLTCVDLDFAQAGVITAQHLIELGHESIALIAAPHEVLSRHTSFAERIIAGFRQAAEAAGVRHIEIPTANSSAGAKSAVDDLLTKHADVTGVVIHNEAALPHILARLAAADEDIPQDRSVIAVCPESVALSLPQPVTSVDLPAERIGRISVEMLMVQLESGQAGMSEVRLIEPVLTNRGTTSSPGMS